MSHLPSLTPAIRINGNSAAQHNNNDSPHTPISSSPTMPMPIRNASREPFVPPALPPPRHLPAFDNRTNLQNSRNSSYLEDAYANNRGIAGSLPSTKMPQSENSRPSLARLQSESHLSLRTQHNSSERFDRHLLNKLDGPRRPAGPASSLPPVLPPISVNGPSGPESPRSRWPGHSPPAPSPKSANFRSPLSESHSIDHPVHSPRSATGYPEDPHHNSNGYYGPHAHRRSVEHHHSVFADPEFGHDDSHRDASDKSPSSQGEESHGVKRRAPSPPLDRYEDRHPLSYNDYHHRRPPHMMSNRSPGSRPHYSPHGESLSSNMSYQSTNSGWSNSVASSATSYWSDRPPYDPQSPHGSEHPDFIQCMPYIAPRRQSGDFRNYEHVRVPEITSDGLQGQYACECCPKKPKRFQTIGELRAHESEKAWKCNFCSNRFKNKNEAERHQNSLHLRRFSWSCSALVDIQNAFQPNPVGRMQTSSCGYCGQEFSNVPEPNWKERDDHLRIAHKYGDCNQHKKFFRADHFRQHLKHSHAATSGKWTNILEQACVRDEPLPPQVAQVSQVSILEPKNVVQLEIPVGAGAPPNDR